jgi:hypothetical protein
MSSTYAGEEKLSFETPQPIFDSFYVNVPGRSYDVAQDGKFVLMKRLEASQTYNKLKVLDLHVALKTEIDTDT